MRENLDRIGEFKDSPVGRIPKDWDVKTLASITSKIIDGTHFTPTYIEEGVPFLRVTDIQKDAINFDNVKKISEQEHHLLSARCNPQLGDILYSKNGTIGITKIVDWQQKFSIFVSLCLIRPIPPLVNSRYLAKILQSFLIEKQIRVRSKQMTVTNLHLEEIREFLIPFPSRDEQDRITEILDTIDSTIAHTGTLIAKLKQMKTGLLQDLLTRGLNENGELRDATQHPEQFKDSPLGQIPKDWEVKDLNSITSKIIDGTHFTPTYLEEGIPFLRVTDIQNSHINFNSVKRISLQEHRMLNIRCNPEFGDILYSKNGTVGITKVIDWRQEFSIFVSLCLIKPITALIDVWYLAEILQSPVVIEQIRVRSKQMTVVNLHLEEIREFLIPFPTIKEQKRIVEAVRIYNNRIRTEEAYLKKLKLQKQGLMHDLLTGKVRVNQIKT